MFKIHFLLNISFTKDEFTFWHPQACISEQAALYIPRPRLGEGCSTAKGSPSASAAPPPQSARRWKPAPRAATPAASHQQIQKKHKTGSVPNLTESKLFNLIMNILIKMAA